MSQDYIDVKRKYFSFRYMTNLNTANTWYADDNGLEMQTRHYNQGETERVAGRFNENESSYMY